MANPKILSNRSGWLEIGTDDPCSVPRTFDCGQCFRFSPLLSAADTPPVLQPGDGAMTGVAFGKRLQLATSGGRLFLQTNEADFHRIWRTYLALDADYNEIDRALLHPLSGTGRSHMEQAQAAGRGIRILRQEKWETLCSFIISQNNNIPRIRKIIEALCRTYGMPAEDGSALFAFPAPEVLAQTDESSLRALGAGFRAGYILDAAQKIVLGEVNLEEIAGTADYNEAAAQLQKIRGVGPKVAACTLLFGFGRTEAFPIDVWIRRVLGLRFPEGLDPAVFGAYAGIAQQYLFYYERFLT